MNDHVVLTLHCPKCMELVEVVTEENNLVCMDCGWKFDDKVAAKFLNRGFQQEPTTPAKPAIR
jgi:hypothetical protein